MDQTAGPLLLASQAAQHVELSLTEFLHSFTHATCLAVSSPQTTLVASFISSIGLNLVQRPFLQEAFHDGPA